MRISSNMPDSTATCGNIETRRESTTARRRARGSARGPARRLRRDQARATPPPPTRPRRRSSGCCGRTAVAEHRRVVAPGRSRAARRTTLEQRAARLAARRRSPSRRGRRVDHDRRHQQAQKTRPGAIACAALSSRQPSAPPSRTCPTGVRQTAVTDGDDQEQHCRRRRAEPDVLEIHQLLAGIDRHRHGGRGCCRSGRRSGRRPAAHPARRKMMATIRAGRISGSVIAKEDLDRPRCRRSAAAS